MVDPELDVDIRTVTIMWVGDDEFPTVEHSDCSTFEAEGLAAYGLRYFQRLNEPDFDDDEDSL